MMMYNYTCDEEPRIEVPSHLGQKPTATESTSKTKVSLTDRLIFTAVPVLVAWQVFYFSMGAVELGGKYLSLEHLAYEIGSLVPALLMGSYCWHLVWMDFLGKRGETLRQKYLTQSHCFVWVARAYLALLAILVVFLPISGYAASFFD